MEENKVTSVFCTTRAPFFFVNFPHCFKAEFRLHEVTPTLDPLGTGQWSVHTRITARIVVSDRFPPPLCERLSLGLAELDSVTS